jgi:hypothetical protein
MNLPTFIRSDRKSSQRASDSAKAASSSCWARHWTNHFGIPRFVIVGPIKDNDGVRTRTALDDCHESPAPYIERPPLLAQVLIEIVVFAGYALLGVIEHLADYKATDSALSHARCDRSPQIV